MLSSMQASGGTSGTDGTGGTGDTDDGMALLDHPCLSLPSANATLPLSSTLTVSPSEASIHESLFGASLLHASLPNALSGPTTGYCYGDPDALDLFGSSSDDVQMLFGSSPLHLSGSCRPSVPAMTHIGGLVGSVPVVDALVSTPDRVNPTSIHVSSTAGVAALATAPSNDRDTHTVFGFGSFESTFLTDEEIKVAQTKLPSEEIKTREQALEELRTGLLAFQIHAQVDPSSLQEDTVSDLSTHEFKDITIGSGYTAFGCGSVRISSDHKLLWSGTFPSVSNTSIDIGFNLKDIGSVHEKQVDESCHFVNLAVMHDRFIQFMTNDATKCHEFAECLRIAKMAFYSETTCDSTLPDVEEIVESTAHTTHATLKALFESKANEALQRRNAAIELAESNYTLECAQLKRELETQTLILASHAEPPLSSSTAKSALSESMSVSCVREIDVGVCSLCYDGMVTLVLKPCLHTLCAQCAGQLQGMSSSSLICPWDRMEVKEIHSIADVQ
ncbi:hypothetical protein BASA60_010463 [Batrachochytrium salamandrivorans]|nr:hypothetical protein BASA60_010463 [Batrachochytrium salamandrivorans]KAH9272421.1 hypothetical protein BASA83_005228 [Batrachochytrium salamandrivorans]